jgi:hypothetical protein
MKSKDNDMERRMSSHKDIILEAMNSMLASAQLEAMEGVTLEKFLIELELRRIYPKKGPLGKFSVGQVRYIKSVLDHNYPVRQVNNEYYYIGRGLFF